MADKDDSYFNQGRSDCRGYYSSQAYTSLSRFIEAEAAMKLFWPNLEEQNVQMAMPLPKPRQKWLAGFRSEQKTIWAEQLVSCRSCGQKLPAIVER